MAEEDAGDFGTWRDTMRFAIRGDATADVPCGSCTACCTASQFIHVEPDERDTLAAIPRELLFDAPGLPDGHKVMGYDERGACPMFVDGGCSIYERRPRACRTYDCRLFAATGVDVTDDGKPGVAARVEEWRFRVSTDDERRERDAMQRAAAFLQAHADALGTTMLSATHRALLAFAIAATFRGDESPSIETVTAAIAHARASR